MSRRFVGLLVLMIVLSVALAACGDNTAAPTALPAATSSSGGDGSATTAASGTAASSTSVAGTNPIAPYAGLTAISDQGAFSQSLEATVRKGANSNISGFQFSYFTTSDNSDKVLAYYDDAVPQAGYTKQGSQSQPMPIGASSVNAIYHVYVQKNGTSGGQIYEVTVLGPLDATTAQGMSSGNTTYNQGDSVVVITQCVVTAS